MRNDLAEHGKGTLLPNGVDEFEQLQKLIEADAALLVDVSGSMSNQDAGETATVSRWDVMVRTTRQLVQSMEGTLAVVAFNDTCQLVLQEMPPPMGSTDVGAVLRFVGPASAFLKQAILVSDGEPTSGRPSPEESALSAAKSLKCGLDCVYVGPLGGKGEKFLQKLAAHVGGSYQRYDLCKPAELVAGLKHLLLSAKASG